MKTSIISTGTQPWQDKHLPALGPERKGQFIKLSTIHGLTQFEARLTRIPPGEESTWYHRHSHVEEWFYVLSGTASVCINGVWSDIRAGDSIATSPEDWHIFRNQRSEPCDILMVGIECAEDRVERAPVPPHVADE